ncbi:MAG: hypothetical protein QOE75_169 [Solirubrobacterales bacterium]|nr:hypothetical protein [Solirubrobacterales bacterium]
MSRRALELFVVRTVNQACDLVDSVAYRPAIVRLTRRLPFFWHCQLARASIALDERWGTGYWDSEGHPPVPEGLCDACGRRAAWLVVGGSWSEDELDDGDEAYEPDFLDEHPVNLCSWCQLDIVSNPRTHAELDAVLTDAAERSFAWRWRWRPMA